MGWIWRDDGAGGSDEQDFSLFNPNSSSNLDASRSTAERCSTRRVVRSQCRTEEVEPGKFIRKCEKTEEILKDCLGRRVEVVESIKEYTEDDVTDQVVKGNSSAVSFTPFDLSGLRSDIEAIEGSFMGGMDRFFEAAEEMKKSIFDIFGAPDTYDGASSSSSRRQIPIEGRYQEVDAKQSDPRTDT